MYSTTIVRHFGVLQAFTSGGHLFTMRLEIMDRFQKPCVLLCWKTDLYLRMHEHLVMQYTATNFFRCEFLASKNWNERLWIGDDDCCFQGTLSVVCWRAELFIELLWNLPRTIWTRQPDINSSVSCEQTKVDVDVHEHHDPRQFQVAAYDIRGSKTFNHAGKIVHMSHRHMHQLQLFFIS